ncbi:GAF domain-containing SpoIIE family protein phosphatase [Microscilla marina]|uniref:Serine/threonine kinase with GAF domain n=1 Tax=Microscilla marina ATCC 23134 TaxID=313606 RepID=A1ZCB6_MICM2|nr:SpoIIE family protein phosphatase [Microscilla marina]EAY31918.1 serine/threonine kinase with GAF domain [Microscilla marina ATCC 23134]
MEVFFTISILNLYTNPLVDHPKLLPTLLENKEFYDLAVAKFVDVMQWHQDIALDSWAENLLENLIPLVEGVRASLYVASPEEKELTFLTGFALDSSDEVKETLCYGEDLIGQAAKKRESITVAPQVDEGVILDTTTSQIPIRQILVQPIVSNNQLSGVMEVLFFKDPEPEYLEFLKQLNPHIGSNLNLHIQEEKLKSRNNELDEKNKQITSSIKYAKNIQDAILPVVGYFEKAFRDHFILFLPKDIVSGDFYWVSQVENNTFLAVVDCTGHGVAGAFMSMIGNTLLNQIINEKHILEPEQILDVLNHNIRLALKQDTSNNKDGMDLGICRIASPDENGKIAVVYAGAKRPLYTVHQGELVELPGDRYSIGGWFGVDLPEFTNKTITLEVGDVIYITTDGYSDAANERRKKFGRRKLKKLLFAHNEKSMQHQKRFLHQALNDHQLNTEQRDDITVVGVRL